MTAGMRAAFTLTLDDKLTTGLNAIKKQFEALRNKGNELTLGKLERGGEMLRVLGREIRNLTSDMTTFHASVDRAAARMKQLVVPKMQAMKKWAEPATKAGVIGAAVEGYSLIEPVRKYADYQNIALHSAITKGLSGTAATGEATRLMRMFDKDALETGQTGTSIAQAYQDLIQTGMSPALAEKMLPVHSRAATAYNISPEALGHAVFALSDSFKIDETGMGGALASMALASKEGRFKVEDFSRFLPGIGGDMAKLGMTGRGNVDKTFAALETVMRNSPDPGTGATNFTDFMNYLTSPHAARSFALESRGMAQQTKAMLQQYHITGFNMPKLLETARKQGVDPLTAVLSKLQEKTAGLPADVRSEVLGAFITNKEGRDAALAMLLHAPEMKALIDKLGGANSALLDRDYATASSAPKVELDKAKEALDQIQRRIGEGFEPVVVTLSHGVESVLSDVKALDGMFPGLSNAILGLTATMLSAGVALGVLGKVAPAVGAGASMLGGAAVATGALNPFTLVVALPVALAVQGWNNAHPELDGKLDQRTQLNYVDPNGLPAMTMPSDPAPPAGDYIGARGNDPRDDAQPSHPYALDVTIHADPGTSATVNAASAGIVVNRPYGGQTTNRP